MREGATTGPEPTPGDESGRPAEGAEREAALLREIGDLSSALDAVRTGGVDAVMMPGPDGEQLYALTSTDRPYRVLVEEMGEGAATFSEHGSILYANQRFADLVAHDRADLPGKNLIDLVHSGDIASLSALLATAPGATAHEELTLAQPDGSSTPVLASVTGLHLDGATVIRCLIVADLTEVMKARQEAQAGQAALRATLDSLLDPHVSLEAVRDARGQIADFVYVDANPAACAYNHMEYEDLVGARLLDLQPGSVGHGLLGQYRHVVETGEALVLDDSAYAEELLVGHERHYDVRAARVGDGLFYTWRDVTDRHEAAKYASRMAAVVEQTHDAIIGVSFPDTLVTSWNRAAERMYGYTAEEVIGQTASILTPKDQLEQVKGLMAQLSAGETVVDFETVQIRKDGSRIPVSVSSSPIRDAAGMTVGLSTIHRDITKEKAAREETQILTQALKASNDSLRDFVAVASHDLRSPLVTIAGFTRILTENWAKLSEKDRLKQLRSIQRGVDRLSRLTNDLLTSAKAEAAAEQARPEHIRLTTALAGYLQAAREELGTVAVTCPPELVAVVDPSHLTRILDNYLGNALKYGAPPIRIEAERVGDFVELRVRDHGPGVPPEFVSRLFTKFDRADTPTTRAMQGTGLGLSIVKALAEANHGDARYQHNEPHGGCFVVRLPAAVA